MKWRTVSLLVVVAMLLAMAPAALAGGGGFDEFGYNRTARNFVGTCVSWGMGKYGWTEAQARAWCGPYSDDQIQMKWNAEWDRGNAEGWSNPPYNAWENNNWNGAFEGGSGSVWHYKIVWVGSCGANYTPLPNGGYCLWGQFEVIMDQGIDPNIDEGHIWFALAKPAGYGAY